MKKENKPYDEQISNAHDVIDSGVHDAMCVLTAEKPTQTGTDIEVLMGTDTNTLSPQDNAMVRLEMLLMNFEAVSAMLDIEPVQLADYLVGNYGDGNVQQMKNEAVSRRD